MRISDLHEGERLACGGNAGIGSAECARHAAGDAPDNRGAGPGGETTERLAAAGLMGGIEIGHGGTSMIGGSTCKIADGADLFPPAVPAHAIMAVHLEAPAGAGDEDSK